MNDNRPTGSAGGNNGKDDAHKTPEDKNRHERDKAKKREGNDDTVLGDINDESRKK